MSRLTDERLREELLKRSESADLAAGQIEEYEARIELLKAERAYQIAKVDAHGAAFRAREAYDRYQATFEDLKRRVPDLPRGNVGVRMEEV